MQKDSQRDPNLLSDDEVFLDSTSTVPSGSTSVPITGPVVIRTQYTAVQGTVGKGEREIDDWNVYEGDGNVTKCV